MTNQHGQLGSATQNSSQAAPKIFPAGIQGFVSEVYTGENHSLVLLTNSTLASFGSNSVRVSKKNFLIKKFKVRRIMLHKFR